MNEVLGAQGADGLVDYPGVESDRCFSEYLTSLARMDPNTLPTSEDRLVFWSNTYNAFAMEGIIDRYSPNTPR
ncbi:MAG: hypothetical protein ABW047_05535 [Nitrospiraceae bacterium]